MNGLAVKQDRIQRGERFETEIDGEQTTGGEV